MAVAQLQQMGYAKVTNLGDKTATYQWYKNGTKIDGATAATYTTEALFSDLNELYILN